ncbi:MAG TPA: hypothetical protein VKI43_10300 [Vicinamibacterales bacterium]|nr:hypothetical protein [Vicinamibacterales bacterium]
MLKQSLVSLLIVGTLATGACSNSADSTAVATVTAPTTPPIVENFSGTVQVGGSDAHNFTVVLDSQAISIDLTSAGPPATITMGFGIGSSVGGTCQLLSGGTGQGPGSATPQLSGTIPLGTYCFMVFDVGNQAAPVTYTAVITHF